MLKKEHFSNNQRDVSIGPRNAGGSHTRIFIWNSEASHISKVL